MFFARALIGLRLEAAVASRKFFFHLPGKKSKKKNAFRGWILTGHISMNSDVHLHSDE